MQGGRAAHFFFARSHLFRLWPGPGPPPQAEPMLPGRAARCLSAAFRGVGWDLQQPPGGGSSATAAAGPPHQECCDADKSGLPATLIRSRGMTAARGEASGRSLSDSDGPSEPACRAAGPLSTGSSTAAGTTG